MKKSPILNPREPDPIRIDRALLTAGSITADKLIINGDPVRITESEPGPKVQLLPDGRVQFIRGNTP